MPTDRPSPFTIPTPSIHFAEGEPSQPPPPREMAVEHLIHNLTTFADFYERATTAVEAARPSAKPYQTGHRDANAEYMQRCFRATPGIERVRAYVLAHYGEELTVGTARRVLGDLIRLRSLSVEAAGSLSLDAAMDELDKPDATRAGNGPPTNPPATPARPAADPALPEPVRNWLTARYLSDPTPGEIRLTPTGEPEPVVFVTFEDFAGFLSGAGIALMPNLDDWMAAGWISDFRADIAPTARDADAVLPGVARLNLPPGRHRLVGIRRAVLTAPTAPPPGTEQSEAALRARFLELHALATSREDHQVPLAVLSEYLALQTRFGVFQVDGVTVGPIDPTRMPNSEPIFNTDCIPIPGPTPRVCPRSSPRLPVEFLRGVDRRFRELRLVGADQSVLWVGRQARMETLCMYRNDCGCFDESAPPAAAPKAGGDPSKRPADRTPRDPNQPGKDRHDDILATIRAAGTPLTRPELKEQLKLKTEGKLGANLAWMVANGFLVNIPHRGYWPANLPVPE